MQLRRRANIAPAPPAPAAPAPPALAPLAPALAGLAAPAAAVPFQLNDIVAQFRGRVVNEQDMLQRNQERERKVEDRKNEERQMNGLCFEDLDNEKCMVLTGFSLQYFALLEDQFHQELQPRNEGKQGRQAPVPLPNYGKEILS